MTTAAKAKRATNLDRLLEQGEWVALLMDGNKPPCRFMMPTAELQEELEKELEKRIRKHLKDGGFVRVCGTRRDHPFHSDLLRERIDALASGFDPRINSEEGLADLRKCQRHIESDPGQLRSAV
jgi:hypothetical protein